MASTIFFSLAIVWTFSSLGAVVRLQRTGPLSLPIMMIGWLVGDHPVGHILAQTIVAATLIGSGALDDGRGWIAVALTITAWSGLAGAYHVSRQASRSAATALTDGLGPIQQPSHETRLATRHGNANAKIAVRPNGRFRLTGINAKFDIAYGDHPKRNLLDIYSPVDDSARAPVLVQVHGGGWAIGHKQQQGFPLMKHMARAGWVCVSINYRLAPRHRFPEQIIDVKRAIAWIRNNIADHGGDPSKIVLTGGSAGGHLTSLAALTPDLSEFQPGFENEDTSVAACVAFYGPSDFTNRFGIRGKFTSMEPFMSHLVMPRSLSANPEMWELMSPINHVSTNAPPFFIIQGSNDVLVWREETRRFAATLREASERPVVYWEVPGAQHAFDTLPSHRTTVAVEAIDAFLTRVVTSLPADSTQ